MSLLFDFRGNVIVVTGGASVIGRGLVLLLHQSGAQVSIADVRPQSLDDLMHELNAVGNDSGAEAMAHTLDVSDAAQVDAWITATKDLVTRRCANF